MSRLTITRPACLGCGRPSPVAFCDRCAPPQPGRFFAVLRRSGATEGRSSDDGPARLNRGIVSALRRPGTRGLRLI